MAHSCTRNRTAGNNRPRQISCNTRLDHRDLSEASTDGLGAAPCLLVFSSSPCPPFVVGVLQVRSCPGQSPISVSRRHDSARDFFVVEAPIELRAILSRGGTAAHRYGRRPSVGRQHRGRGMRGNSKFPVCCQGALLWVRTSRLLQKRPSKANAGRKHMPTAVVEHRRSLTISTRLISKTRYSSHHLSKSYARRRRPTLSAPHLPSTIEDGTVQRPVCKQLSMTCCVRLLLAKDQQTCKSHSLVGLVPPLCQSSQNFPPSCPVRCS